MAICKYIFITVLITFSCITARAQDTSLNTGSIAPEIKMKSIDNQSMSLSNYRGQYLLVYFWASWCKACREMNPELVSLFYKYNNEKFSGANGFSIYSVAIEKHKEDWIRAVNNDGLLWKSHVSDLKYWKSQVTDIYEVDNIPYFILLDPNGKILFKGYNLKDIDDYLYNKVHRSK